MTSVMSTVGITQVARACVLFLRVLFVFVGPAVLENLFDKRKVLLGGGCVLSHVGLKASLCRCSLGRIVLAFSENP